MIIAALGMWILLQNPMPSSLKSSSPPQKYSRSAQQYTPDNQSGTENSPIIVKILPAQKTPEESAQEAAERQEKTSSDWWLDFFTGILALMALIQAVVFAYQGRQLRKTVQAAEGQSADMKNSIAEAKRAATAMENVATHFEASVKATIESTKTFSTRGEMQMRAYLCSAIGSGIFQERLKNLHFQAIVTIINAGSTPAHSVRWRIRASILPLPTPHDFGFPLPDKWLGGGIIGPHQQTTLNPMVEDFCDDAEVDKIKRGEGKALHAWGIVEYRDVFGNVQTLRFGQIYTFVPDGKIMGYFTDRHNDAT